MARARVRARRVRAEAGRTVRWGEEASKWQEAADTAFHRLQRHQHKKHGLSPACYITASAAGQLRTCVVFHKSCLPALQIEAAGANQEIFPTGAFFTNSYNYIIRQDLCQSNQPAVVGCYPLNTVTGVWLENLKMLYQSCGPSSHPAAQFS